MMDSLPVLAAGTLFGLMVLFLFFVEAGSLRLLLAGYFRLRRAGQRALVRDDGNTILKSPLVPAVSVLAAPPDSSADAVRFVQNLVRLHYGDHEVVVILDGPSDDDLAVWLQEFHLYASSRSASGAIATKTVNGVYESSDPIRLTVVDKEKGGRADCLNVGLNLAGADLVAVADHRTRVIPEILLRLVRPFLVQPGTTAAASTMVPPSGAGNFAARFHALESTRGWMGRAAGLANSGVALPVPGSLSLFDRKALREANGFQSCALEVIFHMHAMYRARNRDYRIEWVTQDLAVPEPVRSFRDLAALTAYDQFQVRQALARHWAVLGAFGSLGRVALPGLMFTRVARPAIETLCLIVAALAIGVGWFPWQAGALLLLATAGFGMLNSMLAVLLRETIVETGLDASGLLRLFVAAIPEHFGYRQVRNLLLLRSLLRA